MRGGSDDSAGKRGHGQGRLELKQEATVVRHEDPCGSFFVWLSAGREKSDCAKA